jgi:hypothetical protein
MSWKKFWQWYDRAARVDFAGTLLGFFFDWKTWISTLVGGGGGVVTFTWAAIEGRSPLEVWVLAVTAGAALVALIYYILALLEKFRTHAASKNKAFEILFDQNDSRFVRLIDNDATRYCIGLHILAAKSVIHPNVRARESEFTTRVIAVAHPSSVGTYSSGPVQIYLGGALDPDDIEIIKLFDLPSYRYLYIRGADDPIGRVQRFVLEARGRDVRTFTAEFEYDPTKIPMIRMVS